MIDTLLLDVDGVVQFPREQFVTDIERDHHWRAGYLAFEHELLHDPGEARALVGDGDLLDVAARVLARHVTGVMPRQFLDRWLAERIEPNQELLDLLPRLNVTQIFLATNQEVRRGSRIRQLHASRPGITGILMSHELGYRKPQPAFFQAVLARVARRPGQCLFVDDKPGYIDGAAQAGIPTVLFRDNAQLVAELAALRLLRAGHGRLL